ncbi:MAG: AsmA family protein [Gammaproteobacteria bacterium]|jgi:AsmA protein|uniref:AsmA family protein n=1 Tax=Stutzerimonas xanthomarina TaxID=271420 RepID=UPI000E9D372C|nr:AsmA family protein [Stutzerimonas xanthomarina]MBU0811841.1 AsmA family protein [Gammaproteobacteria bacterium]HAW22807.1 AsmA family protein [Pseudomonas sp.]MBK3849400.1 AsmA family protein [Stutzerimonas xanthomarina]MBU0853947.1 AsmA family protein [Gammaproteobacteria bacterium]MBU1459212.1 AsmA family protein [Gammaproteobacteria bacterium]|tara:strand:- start:1559 stop:3784 length:2226 start_codon:yes stop_codon:yes gene_type:complete
MKALGKILGLVILGLLLLIVALGFALTHLFDPNDYKDEIRTLARDKAGLELNIAGDIGWSLFPWLGLELHDTTLASVQTPEQPFADLRMLGLSVRVLPLLSREVEMSDITLNGLNLTLNRDEKGRGNWEGVGRPATSETPPDATPPTKAAEPGDDEQTADNAKRTLQLDIDSLTISDARVTYHDAQTGQQFSAEGIELTTGAIREATSIPIKLNAFFGSNKPVMRARTELQGALRFDTKLQRYQLEDLRLSGEASGEPLQGKTLSFSAQGQLLADLAADIAEWTSLKFTANQLRGLGELKARDLQDQPKITGALSIAEFNLREFLESIGQQLPAMTDNTALGKAELVTRLAGTPTSLTFEEINLKLDGSTFTGQIAVSDFAKQALRVDLSGDQLNLDRYLPPPEKEDPAGAARQSEVKATQAAVIGSGTTPLPGKPTQQAWSSTTALPVSALRNLDTRINLGIDNLTAMKLPVDNFALKARTAGGLLTLEQLRGGLYNGRVEASASLDVRPQVPLITAQTRLARVPIEGLLQSQGEEVVIKGLLNLDSDIRTQGNSQQAWIDNLNGKIGFIIDNGILVDANLEQQLCRAIATLNRKPLSSEPRGKDTPFRELKGNLTLRNGVASNPDLKVSIPGLTVNGEGDVDLRVLGMDYRIGLVIEGDKGDMPDPACAVNERYVGIEWPLRCRGPLELGAKACRFDNDRLGKIAARLAGDKLNETIEEKLGDKVSPELKDALKGLFNR